MMPLCHPFCSRVWLDPRETGATLVCRVHRVGQDPTVFQDCLVLQGCRDQRAIRDHQELMAFQEGMDSLDSLEFKVNPDGP